MDWCCINKEAVTTPSGSDAAAGVNVDDKNPEQMLVMCGGEGYIDFRLGTHNLTGKTRWISQMLRVKVTVEKRKW